MNPLKACKITGTGKYLPEEIVTSYELEQRLKLPIGWIEKHSGVKQRHRANCETNAEMGVLALSQALEKAGLKIIAAISITFN